MIITQGLGSFWILTQGYDGQRPLPSSFIITQGIGSPFLVTQGLGA